MDEKVLWVDGIHVQARLEDEAQCLLVIIGATPEGKKEIVGPIDDVRESTQSWRERLLDLKRRGLTMGPELATADGALGFWQAVEQIRPKTRGHRCWVHKTASDGLRQFYRSVIFRVHHCCLLMPYAR
jgi:transposase-like protein